MKINLGLGVSLLMACGGNSGQGASSNPESARAASAPGADPTREVGGGETTEFSGDISHCPEIASSEPLALDDPEVASWAALAQGHHEQTLSWTRDVLSDGVSGFEEHTSVSFDVNVLRGREVVYGSGGATHSELELCNGTRARQLELDISLATADGAVIAAVREWFEPRMDEERLRLGIGALHPDRASGGVDFTGSLQLGLDPALGGRSSLGVNLSFDSESVRGSLSPQRSLRDGSYVPNRSDWAPLQGHFPDEPCLDSPIGLDEIVPSLGETPRAAFQRTAAAWASEPILATWTATPYGIALPGVEAPPPTEVSLSLGEPTHACISGGYYVTVAAPLTVVTADGRMNLTQQLTIEVGSNGALASLKTPWIPDANFSQQAGISGVNLDAGSYGALNFLLMVDFQDDRVEGAIGVWQWQAFIEEFAPYPMLEWCKGTHCSAEPER
jgi:hypothetical protein